MSEWWSLLNFEQQIYYGIAFVASGLVLLQTALMLVGGADLVEAGDVDMDGPGEHPSGIHLVSSRTIVAFFTGFGWTGAIASRGGADPALSALAAVVVGVLFAFAILQLMRFLASLKHSGTLDYHNALDEIGTVYLAIPAAMGGQGSIQVMVQGRLKVVQATTRHGERIAGQAKVRVVELLDENTLVVEPLSATDTGEV